MDRVELVDLAAQRHHLGDRVDAAIGRVLDHGRFILGPEVAELEVALGERCGAHAVTCGNGTDALELALLALGVGAGDAVVVPSFTFCATAEAVRLAGAKPVFADVDRNTALLSAATLSAALAATDRPVKAVISVDLFGQPVDQPALAAVTDVPIVSDAAQSFGATLDDLPVGTLTGITTTSFFPSKPLGCYGDGGAVLVRDPATADLLRSLRAHGQGSHKYDNVRVGMNSRLDTVQAAVLLEKLTVFDGELEARQAVAERYQRSLGPSVQALAVGARTRSAWAQFTVTVEARDDVASAAADAGISTAVYYAVPLHRQPAYAEFANAPLPVTDWLSDRVLSLPMHPYLTDADVDRVVDVVSRAAGD